MYIRQGSLLLLLFIYLRQILYSKADQDGSQGQSLNPPKSNLVEAECKDIDPNVVTCKFNSSCIYGETNTFNCYVGEEITCKGERSFQVTSKCLYCWQLPEEHYSCINNNTCKPHSRYLTTCNVNSTTYCMGHREFNRYKPCLIINGHRWSMALLLSILFGGFGMDRFYLGHWQEGVGKLFSFGGFGVWTLIDTILISIGYLKPADSSQYK